MEVITVKCPICEEVSELYLGSEAFMVILNCPSCGSALIYYYGKTFEATEEIIQKIKSSGVLKNASELLREIQQCGVKTKSAKNIKTFYPEKADQHSKDGKAGSSHDTGQSIRAEYFTRDDLTNLKIELETCKSVEEFIEKLEGHAGS